MPESRFVRLVRIARSTYHSWETERILVRPSTGAYTETQVVEALLVAALRSAQLPLAATRNAMRELRAEGTLASITDRFRERRRNERLDLVIEPEIGDVTVCLTDTEVLRAVRDPHRARTVVVVPLADELCRALTGFGRSAEHGRPPTKRARGRPRTAASSEVAKIAPLRGGG